MRFKRSFRVLLFLTTTVLLSACGGSQRSLEASRTLDAPTVFQVDVTAESRFSGPVSNLERKTSLSGAFQVTPVSDSAVKVETLYLAASVRDANGEHVALSLEPLAGKQATVEMEPSGVVKEVQGDSDLLEASIPLISMREVIWSLFPPLPQEPMQEGDTWTGDMPIPFGNLGGPPHRMRYVLQSIDSAAENGRIDGYELSVRPRAFTVGTPGGDVSGEGDLDVEFEGELKARDGYTYTERTAEFDTNSIRISGGDYANGNLHMRSTLTTELLSPAEQFGLDTREM